MEQRPHECARVNVLVTGGTGFLGTVLIPRLIEAGHEVRVMTRRNRPELPHRVAAVSGDLISGDGLSAAVDGAEVVVHAASSAFRNTKATDVGGTKKLVDRALRSPNPPHIVFPSIVGIDDHPLPYYQAKAEAEMVIEASGVPHTVLRGTQFHVLVDHFLSRALRSPVVPIVKGWLVQPVDESEFAAEIVRLCADDPIGRAEDFAGPQVRTAAELAEIYMDKRGKRSRLVSAPVVGRTLQAYVDGKNTNPGAARGEITWEEWLDR